MKKIFVLVVLGAATLTHGQNLQTDPNAAYELNIEGWEQLKEQSLRYRSDYAPARVAFTKATELAPTYVEPLLGLGCLEIMDGNKDKALRIFTKSIKIQPTAYALFFRGFVYREKKLFSTANEDYFRLLGGSPELALMGLYKVAEAKNDAVGKEMYLAKYKALTGQDSMLIPGCTSFDRFEK